MQALFIGQTYIDLTFLTDRMPTGDEKHVASDYAVSFGGNAVTAAFCCAKLGYVPELLATVSAGCSWIWPRSTGFRFIRGKLERHRCHLSCRTTANGPSSAVATTI